MGLLQDRLDYIKQQKSLASISREAGVSYSTVLRAASGAEVSDSTREKLSNYYSNETYRRLRDAGVSVTEASKKRGGAVSTVSFYENAYNDLVESWAFGAALSHFGRDLSKQNYSVYQTYIEEVSERIRDGLRSSFEQSDTIIQDQIT